MRPSGIRSKAYQSGEPLRPFPDSQTQVLNRAHGWLFGSVFSANQASRGIEDPMVYVDANGIYHAIFHDMFEKCDPLVEGAGCAWSARAARVGARAVRVGVIEA